MNAIAESYVKLVLAVGQHDSDYVDAYYGPASWRDEAAANKMDLDAIQRAGESVLQDLAKTKMPDVDEIGQLRRQYLTKQLDAIIARVSMLAGTTLSFDDESQALYDAVAPTHSDSHFASITAKLNGLLPGQGPLTARYGRFRQDFIVPHERIDAVFNAAITECRKRTKNHVDLPAGESFVVEYVTDKSWSGYNWYQGNYQSLIQVNTDLPIFVDRAIDLACHEGYPGHHTYNVLLEHHLVNRRGWIEYSVYPLFSPQSLIAEGSANYGIEVAFPDDQRTDFERDVLYPLAGLDPNRAAEYAAVQSLVGGLAYAGNEAARRYLNGDIDAETAATWLTEFAMMDLPRARQRVRFIDQYRSYVINYNLGMDLVRTYVSPGPDMPSEQRWDRFSALLASPRLPSGLR